jgi:hypothetical protein
VFKTFEMHKIRILRNNWFIWLSWLCKDETKTHSQLLRERLTQNMISCKNIWVILRDVIYLYTKKPHLIQHFTVNVSGYSVVRWVFGKETQRKTYLQFIWWRHIDISGNFATLICSNFATVICRMQNATSVLSLKSCSKGLGSGS